MFTARKSGGEHFSLLPEAHATLNNVLSTSVVYMRMYIGLCVMCIRKYECMHCIILYFVATFKRPFGPLLLNKMKWNKLCRLISAKCWLILTVLYIFFPFFFVSFLATVFWRWNKVICKSAVSLTRLPWEQCKHDSVWLMASQCDSSTHVNHSLLRPPVSGRSFPVDGSLFYYYITCYLFVCLFVCLFIYFTMHVSCRIQCKFM